MPHNYYVEVFSQLDEVEAPSMVHASRVVLFHLCLLRSFCAWVAGQLHREGTVLPFVAPHHDLSAVAGNDLFDDIQAYP